jgi:hypothetical protein
MRLIAAKGAILASAAMCESSRLLAQIVLADRRPCKFARNYDPLGRFLRPIPTPF